LLEMLLLLLHDHLLRIGGVHRRKHTVKDKKRKAISCATSMQTALYCEYHGIRKKKIGRKC
jgi:hypothetical protein